jgi:hypothetical protein
MNCLLKLVFTLVIAATVTACNSNPAQTIVDEAITKHGGSAFDAFRLSFDFRDRHYIAARDGGIFTYTREFTDSTGRIKDVLDNHGFRRYHDGKLVDLPKKRAEAFSRSVNAVIYFTLLPFGLNDDPVNKELIEPATIKGEPYDVVRVTFDAHGDGEDHQDIFLYWFHRDEHTMDYFAYSYKTDGGGVRFRESVNARTEGGIRLQDYINYRPEDETIPVDSMMSMFTSGKLRKVSEIRMKNVEVTPYKATDQ